MITKVGMLILMQPDLLAAIEFYKRLGLKLKFHLEGAWAEFEIAGVKIGLCPTSSPVAERRSNIVFEVADLKQFYEQQKDIVAFKSEPIQKIHGLMVSVQDPGGNSIDFYQPSPEKVQQLVKETADQEN